jgi:hypothetical protein
MGHWERFQRPSQMGIVGISLRGGGVGLVVVDVVGLVLVIVGLVLGTVSRELAFEDLLK